MACCSCSVAYVIGGNNKAKKEGEVGRLFFLEKGVGGYISNGNLNALNNGNVYPVQDESQEALVCVLCCEGKSREGSTIKQKGFDVS